MSLTIPGRDAVRQLTLSKIAPGNFVELPIPYLYDRPADHSGA